MRVVRLSELGAAQPIDDHREEAGCGGQVEGAIQRLAGFLLELVEHGAQFAVHGLFVERPGHVADVVEQAVQHCLRRACAGRSDGSPARTRRGSPRPLFLCARRRRGGSAPAERPRGRGCTARAAVCAWRDLPVAPKITSVVGATGRRSRPAVSGFSGSGSSVGRPAATATLSASRWLWRACAWPGCRLWRGRAWRGWGLWRRGLRRRARPAGRS